VICSVATTGRGLRPGGVLSSLARPPGWTGRAAGSTATSSAGTCPSASTSASSTSSAALPPCSTQSRTSCSRSAFRRAAWNRALRLRLMLRQAWVPRLVLLIAALLLVGCVLFAALRW